MDEHTQNLVAFIKQQSEVGLTADQIAEQLRVAGWQEEIIQKGFVTLYDSMMPTGSNVSRSPLTSSNPATLREANHGPQAAGFKRGRIRTGWRLLKQSANVLLGNRYLLRYLCMTSIWAVGITIVFFVLYWVLEPHLFSSNSYADSGIKPLGYVLIFFDYLAIYFFINLYAAGLTANVLDIFKGQRKSYHEYMKIAWSKAPVIFVFSLISASVGLFLEYVVERIRFVGWILTWIFGTLWSLGTLFVIPIIVTSEKPSGVKSIGTSFRFFKQTWGETVVAKIGVNAPLLLLQIGLIAAFLIIVLGLASIGVLNVIVVIITLGLFMAASFLLSVVGSFANSLLNIALFYFATYHQAPPAFSAELLNQVFTKRTKRNLFGKSPKSNIV